MSVNVTIQLTDRTARIIRSWQSVGSYLTSLTTTLCDVATHLDSVPDMEVLEESVRACLANTDFLSPAISELCNQLKLQLMADGIPALWSPTETRREKQQ
jgi:hypothetical protein